MQIKTFYDPATYTLTYVVFDPDTKDAVVIDPVLDYEPGASKMALDNFEEVKNYIQSEGLKLHYVLETHAHADHLSSSQYFKETFPGVKIGIGENIKTVQEVFKGLFNYKGLDTDGSQFDHLFADGERFSAGSLNFEAINTPGHTPACISYLIEDAVFTGDALFIEDYGTGRCDFPGGSADDSYTSIHDKLYGLPDATRVFVGHDYQPGGRELRYETTIGKSKHENIYLKADTSRDDFVSMRTERDKGLAAPKLLLPSVQVNINAGKLPPADDNGVSYLKIPIR
ncbi:MAG: MBL fold metallo-hydrolase [Candidatus Sericytochromatia bacterium]|nr:MBL fold metallo-hydrolase [Candidatus Sericytochromatia bacterium]